MSENDARICADNECETALKPIQKTFCSRLCSNRNIVGQHGEAECSVCGTTFKRNNQKHKWCSKECREEGQEETKSLRRCFYCGLNYMGRRGQKFCGRECSAAANLPPLRKWSEGEIAYLARMNPCYGFRNFLNKLYRMSNNGGHNGTRLLETLQDIKEMTGVDYYAHLQDRPEEEFPRNAGGNVYKSTIPVFNWGKFADDPRVVGQEE